MRRAGFLQNWLYHRAVSQRSGSQQEYTFQFLFRNRLRLDRRVHHNVNVISQKMYPSVRGEESHCQYKPCQLRATSHGCPSFALETVRIVSFHFHRRGPQK